MTNDLTTDGSIIAGLNSLLSSVSRRICLVGDYNFERLPFLIISVVISECVCRA